MVASDNAGAKSIADSDEGIIAVVDLGDFASQPSARYGHQPYGLRNLGCRRLFERMARRLSECTLIDRVCVVGSNLPSHVLRGGLPDVEIIALPTMHVCERLAAAADRFFANWTIHVPANRPFVDPDLVDRLVASCSDATCDYVGYDLRDRRGATLGLAGEIFHVDALRRLRRNADRLPVGRDDSILDWLQEAPGAYHLKLIPLPSLLDRSDFRFAITSESDWDEAQLLCDSTEGRESDWRELAALVQRNPQMLASMARRNDDVVEC